MALEASFYSLNCAKIVSGWGSPQTPLGELTALSRPLAVQSRRVEGKGGDGRDGEGRGGRSYKYNFSK